jgi:FkbM family methyltransferase
MRHIRRKLISQLLYHVRSEKYQNLLMWPIARRVLGEHYIETVNIGDGIRMRLYSDMHDMAVKSLLFYSDRVQYALEPITARLFIKLVKHASCVMAAGGHLGYYSLIAARHNPTARIYTFEPVSKTYGRLVENRNINSFTTIHAAHKALSDKEGEVIINVDDGQSSILTGKKQVPREVVEATSMDAYFGQQKSWPDLILLDVEGYESTVLSGAKQTLSHKPDLIMEINLHMIRGTRQAEAQLSKNLEDLGYSLYIILDNYKHLSMLSMLMEVTVAPFKLGDSSRFTSSWANILATTKKAADLEGLGIQIKK